MTNQFKEALSFMQSRISDFNQMKNSGDFLSAADQKDFAMDLICLKALKIAQRLNEEPSEGMIDAGIGYVISPKAHIYCFKDMAAQLIKESENTLQTIENEV